MWDPSQSCAQWVATDVFISLNIPTPFKSTYKFTHDGLLYCHWPDNAVDKMVVIDTGAGASDSNGHLWSTR